MNGPAWLVLLLGLGTFATALAGYDLAACVTLGLLTVAAAVMYAGEHVSGRLTLWAEDEPVREIPPAAVPYVPATIRATLEATLREVEAYVSAQAPGSQMLAPTRDRLRRALDTLPG